MPRTPKLYVAAVAVVAVVVAAVILPITRWNRVDLVLFFVLAAIQGLIVLTSVFPRFAEGPGVPASVAVQLAAVVLLTPGAAAACVTLGALCLCLRPRTPRDQILFVVSGVFLTPTVGAAAYVLMHGSRTLMRPEMPAALLPIVVAALALSAVPALLVGTMTVLGGQVRVRAATRDAVRHVLPRNVAYSLAGLLAAVLWRHQAHVMAMLILLGPLLVTRWAYTQYYEQRAAHDATVRALVQAVEIKDLYTRGHSERVAKASEMIARRLGLEEERISILRYAAILHDVGKLGVPTRLLQKDGKFDDAEFEAIRVHPVRGVDVVRDIAFLNEAYTAILHHHERMDGRGYPTGLAGERIPSFARIIAVADAFDSMTSTRSYRPARSVPDAVAELRACAGSQFDPVMVGAMEESLAEAEREGRPWLGDGTMPDFERRIGLPSRAVGDTQLLAGDEFGELDAALLNAGVPVGMPEDSVADYDHDDPAFVVPSPLTGKAEHPGLSQPGLSQPGRPRSEARLTAERAGQPGEQREQPDQPGERERPGPPPAAWRRGRR